VAGGVIRARGPETGVGIDSVAVGVEVDRMAVVIAHVVARRTNRTRTAIARLTRKQSLHQPVGLLGFGVSRCVLLSSRWL
jgi:hypothetical protein